MTQIIGIIDGTLSRLERGKETHAGMLFKQALQLPPQSRRIFYDPGVQSYGFKKWFNVASGIGLNLSIVRIYQRLSQYYNAGDHLFLFGYSRGAYAVRLLAGIIDEYGLLTQKTANYENAKAVLNYYAEDHPDKIDDDFRTRNLRNQPTQVDFLGVWDTVKALGLPLPIFSKFTPLQIRFKDSAVPENVKRACHAISMDEDREYFDPELWSSAAPKTQMKQVLFRGDHAVVGGQVYVQKSARELGNFSFHWMIEEAERAGFSLKADWKKHFPTDPCGSLHDDPEWYDRILIRKTRTFVPPDDFINHPSVAAREHCHST